MKKQLIVLSALFVGFASQCSLYDRMKAQATAMKGRATGAYQTVKKTAQGMLPSSAQQAIRDFAKQNSPAVMDRAQEIAIAIAKDKVLPNVLSVMKEPVGGVMSQGAKLAGQQLQKMGLSAEAINKIKQPATKGFERVFGAIEEDDSAQVEWVESMYEKQRNATDEAERAIYTKKLQDFFDGEQGQAFALRHPSE
jgi:hypothetical protein